MKEIKGNLWDYHSSGYWVCILTNGIVDLDGSLVMGAGCALEAALKYPDLPAYAGEFVDQQGNHVNLISELKLIMFPTKHQYKFKSNLNLIKQSCKELNNFMETILINQVVILPRPGCGYGGLDWETEVKPEIEPLLNDKVLIISKD